MPTIKVSKELSFDGRKLWKVEVPYDVDLSVVRWGESLGGALQRVGQAVERLEQQEKAGPND